MSKTLSRMLPLGTPCPSFTLPEPGRTGATVSSADFAGRPLLVMFLCNHCPYVLHLQRALAAFTDAAKARGCGVVGINSNDAVAYPADAPDKMGAAAKEAGYRFAYLWDANQEVARALAAACTPDFFLFDAQHRLVYRGRFDGSRPGNGVPLSGADLGAALDALLEGRPIAVDQQPSMGCNIKWQG